MTIPEEFATIESKNSNISVTYFEGVPVGNNNLEMKRFNKTFELSKIRDEVPDFKLEIANILLNRVKVVEKLDNGFSSEFDTSLPSFSVRSAILSGSKYVQHNGRCGLANRIVCNTETYKAYLEGADSTIDGMKVVLNDNLPSRNFFLIHNNTENVPGFKFAYHTDPTNNEKYASILEVGWFPERQAVRIILK